MDVTPVFEWVRDYPYWFWVAVSVASIVLFGVRFWRNPWLGHPDNWEFGVLFVNISLGAWIRALPQRAGSILKDQTFEPISIEPLFRGEVSTAAINALSLPGFAVLWLVALIVVFSISGGLGGRPVVWRWTIIMVGNVCGALTLYVYWSWIGA